MFETPVGVGDVIELYSMNDELRAGSHVGIRHTRLLPPVLFGP